MVTRMNGMALAHRVHRVWCGCHGAQRSSETKTIIVDAYALRSFFGCMPRMRWGDIFVFIFL